MKKFLIKKAMNYIKKYKNISDNEFLEIEYGLTGIYLTFSKIIIISIISLLLGIFKEMIMFMILFNIIRTTAFGLHATKSWICWICSLVFFLFIPFICINIQFNFIFKIIIGVIEVFLIYKNSPADTYKRPIVSKKRRKVLKILSTSIATIYIILSIIIKNNFFTNCLLFSLLLENILISPLIYKLFNLPYNNYISYLKSHPYLMD